MLDDFLRQNASPRHLVGEFQLDLPYLLLDRQTVDGLLKEGEGWRDFHTLYPDSKGFIEVSAVGFDESRTRAMVYVAHYCGGLCGGGMHHVMEKVNGTWHPSKLNINKCW